MEDKKMTGTIQWHLIEAEGNPEKCGDYIVTTDTGNVRPAKWGYRWDKGKKSFYDVWKVQKGVNILAWAEMPEPCEACPIEIIAARKEYERAKANLEKAMEKYESMRGEL